jgi:hypothetical protein
MFVMISAFRKTNEADRFATIAIAASDLIHLVEKQRVANGYWKSTMTSKLAVPEYQ